MSHQNDPAYRLHKKSGRGIVTLPDGNGNRRDVLLDGEHESEESRAHYYRVLAEWRANGCRLPARNGSAQPDLSINEIMVQYVRHVEDYYRKPDGSDGSETLNIKRALRFVKELYGFTPARTFDSLRLEAVREKMIQANFCRKQINKHLPRIKRMWKWAANKKLVPLAVFHDLQTVEGLRAGRCSARETAPVQPVAVGLVEEVLPFMTPQVAAMVGLQLTTGARPGEITIMRTCDLDVSGKVWLYRPATHKTAHHGFDRVIAIGPRGQAILRPWLRTRLDEYLFQPREARATYLAQVRSRRKTKMTPSQAARKPKSNPKKKLGDRYTVLAYGHAIRVACERAHAAAEKDVPENKRTPAPRFHPHQLRHTAATLIRKEFGIDAARVTLGHRSPAITETYAALDQGQAIEVAAKLG